MKLLIRVSEKNIAEGRPTECEWCPVALAFHDAGVPNLAVGPDFIDFYPADGSCDLLDSLAMPPSVRRFVIAFDERVAAEPFQFEMDVPEEAVLPQIRKAVAA